MRKSLQSCWYREETSVRYEQNIVIAPFVADLLLDVVTSLCAFTVISIEVALF
jgi:hypothetical protein